VLIEYDATLIGSHRRFLPSSSIKYSWIFLRMELQNVGSSLLIDTVSYSTRSYSSNTAVRISVPTVMKPPADSSHKKLYLFIPQSVL